ncbi:hypothetical protein L284_12810 [Novosphingobium lindaniclasticum LE124]|uniref:Uncharacterized protein n=1 Tax=Novosphingobium lindaniclasticum LE124 TaxID=1096930 RepID=T0HQX6_9SPHN|nr:hypothetical protein L284_12810 [Novosphingobium lindaniclasticum LE124]
MPTIAGIMRASPRVVGAFSQLLIVGWLARPAPEPGSLPSARRKPGSSQGIKVVGVLVAAGNRQNPCPQDIIRFMDHTTGIARIGNASGKLPADIQLAFGLGQQQNPTVRSQPSPVEGGCDFLSADRWESKSAWASIVHGGCGLWLFPSRRRDGLDTQFPTSEQNLTLLPPTLLAAPVTRRG